ncbi:MAG TPA: hypothetical protein VGN10_02045 [Pyrinomonadaceae bacterium]
MSTNSLSLNPQPWIINRNQDLFWFIGGAVLALLFLVACAINGSAPVRLVIFWSFALDGPHVFSTATRVLFDADERRNINWLFVAALSILVVLSIVFGGFVFTSLVFLGWGHYHIFKQHMGFVFIFKRKAGEQRDYALDRYFTLGSFFLPYVYFMSVYLTGSSQLLLPLLSVGIIGAAVYLNFQLKYERLNGPKLLLLGSYIPLNWGAFLYAAQNPRSLSYILVLLVVTNIGHSMQYLRLMWFHNHNRYSQNRGLSGVISRRWIYFIAAAFVLAFPSRFIPNYNSYLAIIPYTLVGAHFVLDGKIWRIRGNPALAKALGL